MKHNKCLILVVGVFLGSTQLLLAVEGKVSPATYTNVASTNVASAADASQPIALPPVVAPEVTVTFAQLPAQVGDQVAQNLNANLLIKSTTTQSGQIANESQNQIKRRQERLLEVLEVVDGRVRRARVTYKSSRSTVQSGAAAKQGASPEQESSQAVEGKSYLVTRQGERLLVTDLEGGLPTQAEFEIVATNMMNLGLPNPLVKFLIGQTVRVGDRLQLPLEIAQELMGFGDNLGKVKQFELTLKSVQVIDGQQCAVFAATVETAGAPDKPMNLKLFGKMMIQTATCRAVQTKLSGPLGMTNVERTAAGNFQFSARGNLSIAVLSKYGHTRQ